MLQPEPLALATRANVTGLSSRLAPDICNRTACLKIVAENVRTGQLQQQQHLLWVEAPSKWGSLREASYSSKEKKGTRLPRNDSSFEKDAKVPYGFLLHQGPKCGGTLPAETRW